MHYASARDPDGGVEWVEDDSGCRLGEEGGRFLGHDLARPSDFDHVTDCRRPKQKGGLGGSRLDTLQDTVDVARIGQVALRLELRGRQTQLTLEDLAVQYRNVETRNRIGRGGPVDIDSEEAP